MPPFCDCPNGKGMIVQISLPNFEPKSPHETINRLWELWTTVNRFPTNGMCRLAFPCGDDVTYGSIGGCCRVVCVDLPHYGMSDWLLGTPSLPKPQAGEHLQLAAEQFVKPVRGQADSKSPPRKTESRRGE